MADDWLRFSGVHFSFSGIRVFENLDFGLDDRHAILGVVGRSGVGKSTLLNLVAGFLTPGSGNVSVLGSPVIAPGPERPMVFQDHNLFPWMNVMDNVCFGLKARGLDRKTRHDIARSLLRETGLSDVCEKFPKQLSGGMQQRVGLARALAIEPDILLLDEPFGALDENTSASVKDFYRQMLTKHRMKAIHVTHDLTEAVVLCDAILVIRSASDHSLVRSDDMAGMNSTERVAELRRLSGGRNLDPNG
jgi:NitT/TauT family transport system ATP-binding protein